MTDHLAVLEELAKEMSYRAGDCYDLSPRDADSWADRITAAIALMRGQSWQPIETAPRTGIAVLLWQPWKSARNCIVIGHYANGWVCQHFDDMQPEPTHWQPLPAPPKDTADEQ